MVVAVGEPFRRDDGVGPSVVHALEGRVPPDVKLVDRVPDPTALLDVWDGVRLAVVVDAMCSGRPAGTVLRLEADGLARAVTERPTSSHGFSVRDAFELGLALGRLPERLVVYLVEADDLAPGTGLSAGTAAGVEEAARRLAEELSPHRAHPPVTG